MAKRHEKLQIDIQWKGKDKKNKAHLVIREVEKEMEVHGWEDKEMDTYKQIMVGKKQKLMGWVLGSL